jgi:hypothetical protein
MAQKEEFMRGVKSFLEERLPEMLDYILVVSTPRPEELSQTPPEVHLRSRAVRALHDRKRAMPDLQRELIPHEQHFLDIPRHLAIITSAIVRHSRNVSPDDPAIADLYNRCRDVERHALYYVSRHAAPRGGVGGGPADIRPLASSEFGSPTSNYASIEEPQILRRTQPRASSLYSRPKTAPSGAMSDSALHTLTGSRNSQEYPLSGRPGGEAARDDDGWRMSRRQASRPRSASTDSIPSLRSTVHGGIKAPVEAVRPRNTDRKKGFLRSILNRK